MVLLARASEARGGGSRLRACAASIYERPAAQFEVGMIKNGDGSLQDCHKALIHYDKLLVKQKFLVEEGIHLITTSFD